MVKHNPLSKESHKLIYINLVPCKHTFVSRQNNLKSLQDEESALRFGVQACIRNQCEYASANGLRADAETSPLQTDDKCEVQENTQCTIR